VPFRLEPATVLATSVATLLIASLFERAQRNEFRRRTGSDNIFRGVTSLSATHFGNVKRLSFCRASRARLHRSTIQQDEDFVMFMADSLAMISAPPFQSSILRGGRHAVRAH